MSSQWNLMNLIWLYVPRIIWSYVDHKFERMHHWHQLPIAPIVVDSLLHILPRHFRQYDFVNQSNKLSRHVYTDAVHEYQIACLSLNKID